MNAFTPTPYDAARAILAVSASHVTSLEPYRTAAYALGWASNDGTPWWESTMDEVEAFNNNPHRLPAVLHDLFGTFIDAAFGYSDEGPEAAITTFLRALKVAGLINDDEHVWLDRGELPDGTPCHALYGACNRLIATHE